MTAAKPKVSVALAQKMRLRRAAIRIEIRELDRPAAVARTVEVIRNPERAVRTMAIFDLLRAVPNYGRERVVRLLTEAGVPEQKPLEQLTERQSEAIAAGLTRNLSAFASGPAHADRIKRTMEA